MFHRSSLLIATCFAIALVACKTEDPREAGVALGERHVALIRADELDVEQMSGDLEREQARFEEAAARDRFQEGYREAIRPVRAEIAAMVMEAAGEAAGEAIADVMEGVGEGVGRAINGFVRGLNRGAAAPSAKSPEAAEGDGAKLDDEAMKELGRGLGKMVKSLAEGAEAVAEGLDEELDKP